MKRLVPVLIVATVLALGATVAADHGNAPVPASAVTETGGTHELVVDAPDRLAARSSRGLAGDRVLRLKETPRQKARRIIAATWPRSQVANAMRVVKCETGGTYSQWALGDNGNSVSWFQIHLPSHPWVNRARARNNPWYASRAALRIWLDANDYWQNGQRVIVPGGSWHPWTCARILGIA